MLILIVYKLVCLFTNQGPSWGMHNLNNLSIIFKIQRNVCKFHNGLQLS